MGKTITLYDLQCYSQEINRIGMEFAGKRHRVNGPSKFALENILRYSSALNIVKTQSAGTIYQLTN
jgi:hypothetical protein